MNERAKLWYRLAFTLERRAVRGLLLYGQLRELFDRLGPVAILIGHAEHHAEHLLREVIRIAKRAEAARLRGDAARDERAVIH